MRTEAFSSVLAVAVVAYVFLSAMTGTASAFGWDTATALETGAGEALDPQVAVDPGGNAIAVWRQYDGTRHNIRANRFVPATGWGTPTLLETDNAGGAAAPQVAVDLAGNAVAVWFQSDGTRINIWANRFMVGTGGGTATLIETDNAGFALYPQVAVDSAGAAVAVWHQSDGTRNNIWANRFVPGTGWGTATLIETDNIGFAEYPQVAIDPSGNAVAVWYQSDGSHTNILANRFVPGTGWGTATLIETDPLNAFNPRIAVDPDGNAVAAWEQFDGTSYNIYANRFVPGTGWATAKLIESDIADDAFNGQVAVDPAGNAVAVWFQFDGTRSNIWANRFVPGTGWGTATLIETDNAGGALLPQVAVDSSGSAVAVWFQFDGTRSNIWANRFVPATGWSTATLIETDNVGNAESPQVAVDPSGNAVAVWRQFDGIGVNIYASRYVRDIAPPPIDLDSPPDGLLTQGSSIAVSGTSEPGAVVTVNGAATSVSGTGDFSGVVALAEGGNTITVVATDDEGNSATVVRSVVRDSTPPALAVTSPEPGATVGASIVQVSGTASDATSGVVALVVNGLQVDPVSPWNVNVALTDGPQAIVVLARDAAGNSATMSISITYVNPLPGLQQDLRDTRTALNATRDELDVAQDELAATQSGLAAANARADALSSLTLVLAVLLAVAIGVAFLQFVLYRRQRGRTFAETPPSPGPKDGPKE